jgi:colanic acid/amylovoran biosynthesis glycosyltransferase
LPVVGVFRREYTPPTETFVVSQVRGLDRYAPLVLCRSRVPAAVAASGPSLLSVRSFEDSGVENGLNRLAYRYLRRPGRREERWYANALAEAGAGVVHAHFGTDGGYILPVARAAGLPLVVSWYGYDVSRFPRTFGGLGKTWLRPVLREARLQLALTPQMAATLRELGAPDSSVRVHHHGIDCEYWGGPTPPEVERPREQRILLVASFVEKKGHLDLIRAFARVAAFEPECTLRLVGAGPLEGAARALVREFGLETRVDFRGFVPYGDELLAEYRGASIYAQASRTARDGDQEGLPSAILEAMASALPVVSTRHAGIPDAVTPESGLLVDEGDVDGLAQALVLLLGDPALRDRLGRGGRARVFADYNLPTQVRRLESFYDEARGVSAGQVGPGREDGR